MQQSSSGHRNNGRSTGAPAPPPRRSLANLLSTQRRSAAQTDRYRVQRARPFADRSQVDKAVPQSVNGDNGTAISSASPRQSRWGGSNQSSSLGRGGGPGNGGSSGGATAVSQPQQRSPTSNGRSTNDNAKPSPNNSAAKSITSSSSSSRRVRFGEEASTIAIVNPEERPRKRRKSRWDVRPKDDVPAATDTNDESPLIQHIQQKGLSSPGLEHQKKSPIIKNGSVSKTSILKSKTAEQTTEGGEKKTTPHKSISIDGEVLGKTNGRGDSRTSTPGESNETTISSKCKTNDSAQSSTTSINHKSGETANNVLPALENNAISSDMEAFVDDDSPKSVAIGDDKPGNKVPPSTKADGNVRDTSSLDAKTKRRQNTAVSHDRASRDDREKQTSKSKGGQKEEDLQQQSKSKIKRRKALDNGRQRDLSSLSKSDGKARQMLSKQPNGASKDVDDSSSRKESTFEPKLMKRKEINPAQTEASHTVEQKSSEPIPKQQQQGLTSHVKKKKKKKQPNGDGESTDVDVSSLRKESAFEPKLTKRKQIKPAPTEASHTVEQKSSEPITKQQQQGLTSPVKKKKKKEFSPFRIKVGCVVAVRFRKLADGGNSGIVPVVKDGDSFRLLDELSPEKVAEDAKLKKQSDEQGEDVNAPDTTDKAKVTEPNGPNTNVAEETTTKEKNRKKRSLKYYEVWSDPIAGKDDGLALLGSWIKCVFLKSFIINWQKNNGNEAQEKLGRFVEGNVISIGNRECGQTGITVCLLIDRSLIKSLPFLEVVSDDLNDTTLSSSAKKRRELEAKIRGEDKVVVRVVLASIFDRTKGAKSDPSKVSWVIRKRVSAKPAGKKPSQAERKRNKQHAHALFVGDNNDSQAQQEQNWRWIASKCGSMSAGVNHAGQARNMQDSMSQLVGEVVKVDVSPNGKQDPPDTLATVTIKRLVTPEQTKFGRQAHHFALELLDASHELGSELYLQTPIEDLIVIGRQTNRFTNVQDLNSTSRDDLEWNFNVTHSYSANDDKYIPLLDDDPTKPTSSCHYCQRFCLESMLKKCHNKNCKSGTSWCQQCLKRMNVLSRDSSEEETWQCPCCIGKCDCQGCCSTSSERSVATVGTKNISEFKDLVASLMTRSPVDFILPNNIGQLSLRPAYTPLTGSNKSKVYSKADVKDENKSEKATPKKKKKRASSDSAKKPRKKLKTKLDGMGHEEEEEDDDDDVFKPVCHREIPFDQLSQRRWGSSKLKLATEDIKQPFFRENFRPRVIKIGKTEEKTTLTGRAARANQRRMVKSLTAFGDTATKVDHLAGRDREQQLRFDKSIIHGWGVFAEANINAGDMIIEYRGEIIGNAVADKRELEYEKNKFDDYMFRIDAYTVCDATMLGNVARYINASCSPNCCTKIIAAGENKRIVIYAKRDIIKGEELAYDYKFSLEYDSTKRIPCHCGGQNCRGYMNWDKKYV